MTGSLAVTGSLLAIICMLLSAEFMIAYHRKTRGRWRRSEMGWHLMLFTAALWAVFTLAGIRFVLVDILDHPDTEWFRALRFAVFLSIPVMLIWRRLLLSKAQRERGDT